LGETGAPGAVGAVLGAIQAHDRVEVHQPAGLELGDLRIGHANTLAPLALTEARPRRENSNQLDHEPVPQRRGVPVPQHRTLVVVRRRVDRGAQLGVVVVALPAAARARVIGPVVDGSERRRRQAGEDLRVLGDLLSHALAPASHTGVDELPHVSAVLMRTRRTARVAPVASPKGETGPAGNGSAGGGATPLRK
jgi:hypothetical protein